MPCDQTRTIGVTLEKCNVNLMLAALTELALGPRLDADGHTIYFGRQESIDCATGKSRLATMRDASELKQAYSRQVVLATAKKYGWKVTQTENNKFAIQKR